jgi:hypothetical protein
MVQVFLITCISDLFVASVWQIQRNYGKATYYRMSKFGKNVDKELEHNCFGKTTWKRTAE